MGFFAGVSSGLFVLVAGQAMAADSSGSAAEELTLEEVTVTAERVTKDLQKTPQFIAVKSGDELKSEGKVRMEDMLQGISGLVVEPSSQGQDTQIFIRGIGSGAAGVSIVVDGVYQSIGTQSRANTFRATSLDVSQVAVTRGVQNGAGTTALSGTVQVSTNKPVFENQVSGSFTTGSFKTQNAEGVLNMALTGNQALRLAFNSERRDAYASSGLGEVDNRAWRLRYRWQPSDTVEVNATYEESRIGGMSNASNATLATGVWTQLPGGGVLSYTNPYSGVTTQWGQQIAGRQLYYTGNVLSNFAANNAATTTVGVGTLGISATNTNLATNNQYYYPAPTCLANTAFVPVAASTFNAAGVRTAQGQAQAGFASLAAAYADLANLGPAQAMWGCPFNMIALRTGVNWDQRNNPWEDGFRPGNFMNTPSNNSVTRQGNITVNWALPAGDLQIQPSFLYNTGRAVIAARGTGWTENRTVPNTAYRLDTSFTSKMIGSFQYILGFNGSFAQAPEDGYVSGPQTRTVTAAVLPWATNNNALPVAPVPPLSAFAGVAPNGGVVTPWNLNCYSVLPSVNAAGVVQATAKGMVNNSQCYGSVYQAGTSLNNMAFTTQLNYTAWDKLHVTGTARYERFSNQTRPGPQTFLTDADGSAYVYVLPQSTNAAATAANPNSPYSMPYRMNLTRRDLQTIMDSYPTLDTSFGAATWTLNVQYDFTPSLMAYLRTGTGVSASMTDDSSLRPQTPINVVLPDAKVPQFGGNASAAALARSGMPYELTMLAPDRSSRLKAADKTRQLSLGLKSRWFDNRVQVNLEGFYNQFTNRSVSFILGQFPTDLYNATTNPTASQQCTNLPPTAASPFSIALDPTGTASSRGASCFAVYQPVTQGGTGIPFTGKMVSKGVDVDVIWTPTPNDRFDVQTELLSATYQETGEVPTVDANYLRPYVQGTGTNDAVLTYYAGLFNSFASGVAGKQLPNAPKLSVNAAYQHRFNLGNGWNVTPRLQLNYTGAKYFSSGGGGVPATDGSSILDSNWAMDNGRYLPTVQRAVGIWNLFVNVQAPGSKWYVNGYVNNIRNKAVLAGAFGLTTYDVGSRTTNDLSKIITGGNVTLGAPRVIGVTIGAQL